MKNLTVHLLATLAFAAAANAEVKLNPLFSDHCVLQRGIPVPVWGTAEPGEEVVVTFSSQKKTVKAGSDGKWMVRLDPMQAHDTPAVLKAGNAQAADVLVGEVWVCSGQSNMQWPVHQSSNATAVLAAAADKGLRLWQTPRVMSDTPLDAINTNWELSSGASASNFSAVAYYFGRDLRKALQVPVGLLHSSWGGTPAEAWTPRPTLEAHPTLKSIIVNYEKNERDYTPEKAKERYQKDYAAWSNNAAKARAEGRPEPSKPRLQQRPSTSPQRPASLYNAMIHPLLPYGIRGAIWYQGEANASRATEYETLLPVMIDEWRKGFGVGPFPFIQAQIASYNGQPPTIREAQQRIARFHTNTFSVATIDVGEPADIHPKNKEPVGARMARVALARTYGRKIEYSGPVLSGFKVDGARAVLTFNHTEGGLVARDGALTNFTIAATGSTNFVPATAKIAGTKIIVEAAGIEKPGAVRYGWANWVYGDLFNGAGLPAGPFRTDE